MSARIVALILGSVALIAISPWLGPTPSPEAHRFVIEQLRIPRVLVGVEVGACLGVVGAAFQSLFGNPLATPSTTGTTAGAALGALVALVLLPASLTAATPALALFAFVGALAVALPVAALAASGRARVEDVLLAGVAATLAASALTTGLQVQADLAATYRAVRWSLGSLSQVGYDGVSLLLPLAGGASAIVLGRTRALQAMLAGEARAFSQGVDVRWVRMEILIAGALGVAAVVAWCGPIAFVGLVVPHLVRRSLGASRRVLLPMSGVVGAAYLVGCDTAARLLWPGRELPVGVLTAALGAPLLIVLVLRRR
ncbi:MAG TPA: iron ABC transporter permease [Deltaproteobacteria bacterium]|nr:iron ABC transporter permease [Deltaproteobacteria bacterium]